MNQTAPVATDNSHKHSSKSAFTKFTDFSYERLRHKDAWSTADAEPTTGFASLAGHKDAQLITYRANGEGVLSPVWFGRDGQDRLYFHTEEAFGKVKRIARNPQVRLAPRDMRGKPFGPPAMGIARILDPGESAHTQRTIAANDGRGRRLYCCACCVYVCMSGRPGPFASTSRCSQSASRRSSAIPREGN
jgi:PPOX class probable F420-dependent enzyme